MVSIWIVFNLLIVILTIASLQSTVVGIRHSHGFEDDYGRLIKIAEQNSILYESEELDRFVILEIYRQRLYGIAQYLSTFHNVHSKHNKGHWRSHKFQHKHQFAEKGDDDDELTDDDRPESEHYGGTKTNFQYSVKLFLRNAQKYGLSSGETDALFKTILSAPYSEDVVSNIKKCISVCILHDGNLLRSTMDPPLHPVHVQDDPHHDSDNGNPTTTSPLSILMHPDHSHGNKHPDVNLFYHCHHSCMTSYLFGHGFGK